MPMRKNIQEYTRFKDPSDQNKVSGWKNPDAARRGARPRSTPQRLLFDMFKLKDKSKTNPVIF